MANTTDSRRRNLVISGAPHFFKVVVSPADGGIKIPTMFMRKHGSDLKNMVRLEVPTGVAWPVELLHTDNGTWLHKGWKEFAEYYSIQQFHFLVFRYHGNALFRVVIFNTTACEIEYPIEHPHHVKLPRKTGLVPKKEEMYSDDDDDDDVSIEFVEDEAPCRCRGEQRGTKSANALQIWEDDEHLHGFQSGKTIKDERNEGTEQLAPIQSFRAIDTTALKKETSLTYQRAKAFRSKYPSFIAFMQPSYVFSHSVNIPTGFVGKYLSDTKSYLSLKLRLSNGEKTWPVRCSLNSPCPKMSVGWKEFVIGNNIAVGDVCIFELIKAAKTFNLTIFRRS